MGKILSFLYPPRCPACRDIMEDDEIYIHPECRGKFSLITEPRCFKCGRTLQDEDGDICPECRKKRHSYEYGLALYRYNETAQAAMIDYKSNGIRRNGNFFASEAVRELGMLLKRLDPEVLVPVPITEKRYHERGFNQSEYLAERIGAALNIPVDNEILFREKSKKDQKKLSGVERVKNTENLFSSVDDMPYKRICIVDDIFTTGSTIEGCTRVLKENGAIEVGFLVIFSGIMSNN